jgi:hypothetical protein
MRLGHTNFVNGAKRRHGKRKNKKKRTQNNAVI